MSFDDTLAPRDRTLWYRVCLDGAAASTTFSVRVDPSAAGSEYGLDPIALSRGGEPVAIRYRLGRRGTVGLDVFDVCGRRVRHLLGARLEAGAHMTTWDRSDDRGAQVPRGLYFVRLSAGGEIRTRKLPLLGR